MTQLTNFSFQSVISSNNIQFIYETEEFFQGFEVDHTYALDRRSAYWTQDSLKLLAELPVIAWGTGAYPMYTEEVLDLYWGKYIIFANGDINLFGNEFAPSHELRYFCNIKDNKPLNLFYDEAIKGLTLCKHPCSMCKSHCLKYSVINDVASLNSHSRKYIPEKANRIRLFDLQANKETNLKDKFFNLIPFNIDLNSNLIKENK